jgi:long-subunit acyl-CoA synthetase (AMP-forming)
MRAKVPSRELGTAGSSTLKAGPLTDILRRIRDAYGGRILHLADGQLHARAASDVVADVTAVMDRLVAAGVEAGSRVGLMAENRYEWILYDIALLQLGCVSVCFPPAEFATVEMEALAGEYGLALMVTSSRTLGDRAAPSWVLNLDEDSRPAKVRLRSVTEPTSDDVYSIAFSSGTTGQLKALQVTKVGVAATMHTLAEAWEVTAADRILVSLPLSNLQQRIMAYAGLWHGFDVVVTEPSRLFWALARVSPTIVIGPPALFEAVENRFRALPLAVRVMLGIIAGLAGRLPDRIATALRRRTFGAFHKAFGGRARVLITGSAPCRLSTLRLFHRIGLPLYEAYGITEVGILACNLPGSTRLGSVGRPFEADQLWLADDGEIMIRPRHGQSCGYWGKARAEEATTFLPNGVIATGDVGRFDADGFLYIVGRKKQIIVTPGGAKLHPEAIEARLESLPGVKRAVVLSGEGIGRLGAVIVLEPDPRERAAHNLRSAVQRAIGQRNRQVEAHARIDRVAFTTEPLGPENGTLTRSLKVNRRAVWERYGEALVSDAARLESADQ